MDHVLSKISGVTIERRTKANVNSKPVKQEGVPPIRPGVAVQKKFDASNRIHAQNSVTIGLKPNNVPTSNEDEDEYHDNELDQWPEDHEDEDDEDYEDGESHSVSAPQDMTTGSKIVPSLPQAVSKTDLNVFSNLNIPKGLTIQPPKRKVSNVVQQQSTQSSEHWGGNINFYKEEQSAAKPKNTAHRSYPEHSGSWTNVRDNYYSGLEPGEIAPERIASTNDWEYEDDGVESLEEDKLPFSYPNEAPSDPSWKGPYPKKALPIVPPGISIQKKNESSLLGNLSIPKGVTIQPSRNSTSLSTRDYAESARVDKFQEGNPIMERKDLSMVTKNDKNTVAQKNRDAFKPYPVPEKPSFALSEQDIIIPECHYDEDAAESSLDEEKLDSTLNLSDEIVDCIDDGDVVDNFIPPLPQEISIQRSKPVSQAQPKPAVPVPRPNFQLPPGISFGKRPGLPVNLSPSQNVNPRFPVPVNRSPVRNSVPTQRFPLSPQPKGATTWERPAEPKKNDPTKTPKQNSSFPLGNISPKQQHLKMDLSVVNELMQKFYSKPESPKANKVASQLNLPPGITVQQKKLLASMYENNNAHVEPSSSPTTPKKNQSLRSVPSGVSLEKKKPDIEPRKPSPALPPFPTGREIPKVDPPCAVPNVQLPPGISIEKRTPVQQSSSYSEGDSDPLDHDESDLHDEFEDEESGNILEDIYDGDPDRIGSAEEDILLSNDEDGEGKPEEIDTTKQSAIEQDNLAMPLEDQVPAAESSDDPIDDDADLGEDDAMYEDHEMDESEVNPGEDEASKPEEMDFEKLISSSIIVSDKSDATAPNEEGMDQSREEEESDMDDKDVMQNIVDMVAKGEIEGEIEDEKEDVESDELDRKRKSPKDVEDNATPTKKVKRNSEKNEGNVDDEEGDEDDAEEDDEDDSKNVDKSKVTGSHLRKNIREVMDESKLDEATLAAQRQEADRLKRLQDQQRIIRELQKQIQQNKQKERDQSKFLSLLQGNTQTSILKTSSLSRPNAVSSPKPSSHVLLKMANGQQTSLSEKMRELLKAPDRTTPDHTDTMNLLGMVGSSVTIAPVKKDPVDEKKKKKGDVVTLSSDSDDDCIVLSDEEMESEPDEDPTNSGMHTNDRYNVQDDQGRVLVNTAHPPGEPDIFLAPQIARVIKPHQIGGIRFLYDNIIESLELYNTSAGFGCILAHSMGLGKTLQIVSFSDVFLKHTSGKKILCIMPINTIQNWLAEYNMWTPKDSSDADVRCRDYEIYVVNESLKNIHSRGRVILEWHKNGGVLLMGYELFRLLSLKKPIKSKRKRPDEFEEERNRELVEEIYRALVKPGPDLVICDEGHRIKNSHATTSQALKQISTRRRVVLTGYPLQNNLLEYWCMVDFVRPNYLGTKAEFSNMFERPIQNGQCIDSTPQDKRLMRYRAHVLHSLLEGFVQRRSHAVLQQVLPKKEEYVLLLRFTPFQKKLYDTFMNEIVRTVAVPNPLKAFAVCCKIWNHPDVLFHFLKKKGEQIDLELEDALPPTALPPPNPLSFDGGPIGTNVPSTVPWPKRGPGSRGGRVRQPSRKKNPQAGFEPPAQQPPSESPLPSMSHFAVQSSTYTGQSLQESMTFQPNNYFQQQSQQQQPTDQNQQNSFQQQPLPPQNNFNSNANFNTSHKMFPDDQKMFGNDPDMFGGNPQPEVFGGNEFSPPFGSEMDNNYYQGQQQYQQPQQANMGNNTQYNGGNMQRQPYFQGSEGSVNSGFDYSQSTTEFSQMTQYSESNFDNGNFEGSQNNDYQQDQNQQHQYWGNNWPSCGSGNYSGGSSGDEFMSPPKYAIDGEKKEDLTDSFAVKCEKRSDDKKHLMSPPLMTPVAAKPEPDEKKDDHLTPKKDDIPYEWAIELFKNYITGVISNSSKMETFFLILNESIRRQDRMLVFSQSLLTLDLIEEYLQRRKVPGQEKEWARNVSYFRLDGSTQALEREKLINEFNINPNVLVFLVSTRAGSLGINLVGANRVVVFDASWNPCHDTQAVCRVYRYGQKKPCFVYRLVMDCCLERKIYDRQINKQGMADRVVDELNPDAHLSLKEVTNLCWDDQEDTVVEDYSHLQDKYPDDIIKMLLTKHSPLLSKAPFQHESLLIDRKEKKLSQAEKRLAKRSYELEKQASNQPKNLYQFFPSSSGSIRGLQKPIASVKPMQADRFGGMPSRSKWIPAEVWQKQGMTAQEMTLPLDVVIPTNSPEKTSIVLKAGERVMVLKSPKGIYMQLQTGKIIAIRTAFKVGGQLPEKTEESKANQIASALKKNPNVTITHKPSSGSRIVKPAILKQSSLDKKAAAVNMAASKGRVALASKVRSTALAQRPTVQLPLSKKVMDDTGAKGSTDLLKSLSSTGSKELHLGSEKVMGKEQITLPGVTVPSSTFPPPASNSTLTSSSTVPMVEQQGNVPDLSETMSAAQGLWNEGTSKVESMTTAPSSDLAAAPKEGTDIKKEEDPGRGWQGYPMDPYGNYYPGYYGYGPMHGYDGFPYHRNYPPHIPPVKQEGAVEGAPNPGPLPFPPYPPRGYQPSTPIKQDSSDTGAPVPTPHPYPPYPPRGYPPPLHAGVSPIKQESVDGSHATTPPTPMYPPYPAPYPFPYNYPPFPPQAQPAVTPTQSPSKPVDAAVETAPYPAPYGPRPPFPSAPAPGYYPNYPPYRPYHDPNFPYPNYNPYMPPSYGYPMQQPHMQYPQSEGTVAAPTAGPSASTVEGSSS